MVSGPSKAVLRPLSGNVAALPSPKPLKRPTSSPTKSPPKVYLSLSPQKPKDPAPPPKDIASTALNALSGMDAMEAMAALNALAADEEAMLALVNAARLDVADDLAAKVRRQKLKEQRRAAKRGGAKRPSGFASPSSDSSDTGGTTPRSTLLNASVPFWAEIGGANLRLVRTGHSLKSAEVGRLERLAHVQVVERRRTADGTWRAAISLSGREYDTYGWMTLVTKDGTPNATYMLPQPDEVEEEAVRERVDDTLGLGAAIDRDHDGPDAPAEDDFCEEVAPTGAGEAIL